MALTGGAPMVDGGMMASGSTVGAVEAFSLCNSSIIEAVRIGDLELFRSVAEKFSGTFASDRTHNLIVRLRHNLIRIGLRNISISYSRTSVPDVPKKLRLDSLNPVADTESIISKAIRDDAQEPLTDPNSAAEDYDQPAARRIHRLALHLNPSQGLHNPGDLRMMACAAKGKQLDVSTQELTQC
ncbi:hypothetical protein RJ639_020427 [Escallonia herrerae]|uniref:PCI domain-containing protein n=1 Tax=Escallonia herrerae TaxID=1293975 RepID=A0AA89AF39_9ASTE|nr:hypothetical protein RJ639_020427 [Escallonia herrerae]